jgi:hypothetical protein
MTLVAHRFLLFCIDEDLAAMYLTDKKHGTPRELRDHDELELLLEFFAKQVEEIVNEAENTQVSNDRLSLPDLSKCSLPIVE